MAQTYFEAMANKNSQSKNGIVHTIKLLLILACVLLILAYQVQSVIEVTQPEPTRIPYVTTSGPSGIRVEEEDQLPTLTPKATAVP
jgi:hypothetical protein